MTVDPVQIGSKVQALRKTKKLTLSQANSSILSVLL